MIQLLFLSLATAAVGIEPLANFTPTCIDKRPKYPTTTGWMVVPDKDPNSNCYKHSEAISANWKTYHPDKVDATTFNAIAQIAVNGESNALVTNHYTDVIPLVPSWPTVLADTLAITQSQETGSFPDNSRISLQGTLWGIHHMGIGPSALGLQDVVNIGFPMVTIMMSPALIASNIEMWLGNTKEFGLVYTDCVAEGTSGVPAVDASDGNYNCTVNLKAANSLERHHTGLYSVVSHSTSFSTVEKIKTHVATYGPLTIQFACSEENLNTYFAGSRESGYFAKELSTVANNKLPFLVYGWSTVTPPDPEQNNANPVPVWLVKYIYSSHPTTTPLDRSPLLQIEIGANDPPTTYDTTKAFVGEPVFFFVKMECANKPCGSCPADGCSCSSGKCSDCPPWAEQNGCSEFDDAAFIVKVSMFLALLTILLAL
jgi:hypothetical protein